MAYIALLSLKLNKSLPIAKKWQQTIIIMGDGESLGDWLANFSKHIGMYRKLYSIKNTSCIYIIEIIAKVISTMHRVRDGYFEIVGIMRHLIKTTFRIKMIIQ